MKISKYLLVGVIVGCLSLIYNYFIFNLFDFYPDSYVNSFVVGLGFLFFLIIFLKSFFIGLILMIFFTLAYENINADKKVGISKFELKGIFFFILYSVFAFVAFSLGDILLMQSSEGMIVFLVFDGVIEAFIATIPIRFFYFRR